MEPSREQAYRQRIAELEAEVAALKAEVTRLGGGGLVAKLSKDCSNSSKPPSSDIVKPPKPKFSKKANSRKKKCKISGQPGHAKHERAPFSPDQIDDVREDRLNRCPDCGCTVSARPKGTRVVQQVELAEKPVEIVEHHAEGCWCRRCNMAGLECLPASRRLEACAVSDGTGTPETPVPRELKLAARLV